MKKKTLREVLVEEYHLDPTDERAFMIRTGTTDMMVSFRYLGSAPMREYLDRIVKDHRMEYCVYGYVAHCFELSDGDE